MDAARRTSRAAPLETTMEVNVRQRVTEIMADVLDCPPTTVPTLRAGESAAWDSVAAASLLVALEDAFDVMIEPDQAATMTDLDRIVAVIEQVTHA